MMVCCVHGWACSSVLEPFHLWTGFLMRIFILSQTGSQLHVHCATLSNDGPILQLNILIVWLNYAAPKWNSRAYQLPCFWMMTGPQLFTLFRDSHFVLNLPQRNPTWVLSTFWLGQPSLPYWVRLAQQRGGINIFLLLWIPRVFTACVYDLCMCLF